MPHPHYRPTDFDKSPLMFYYETTLACDLVCKHCRASAQEEPHPGELSTEQSKALIQQVASFPRRPMLVMTGGLERTVNEYGALLSQAGFRLHRLIPTGSPYQLVEAVVV